VLPSNVVFGLDIKGEVMNKHPESEEFANVANGDISIGIDFENPRIPIEGFTHLPILSRRGLKD
jgi:hypothetical protein